MILKTGVKPLISVSLREMSCGVCGNKILQVNVEIIHIKLRDAFKIGF